MKEVDAMFTKQSRNVIASGFLVALLIFIVVVPGYAAYLISRPINGGAINQTYLWGEGTAIHKGVDFSYPLGTEVRAVASGTVVDLREDIRWTGLSRQRRGPI